MILENKDKYKVLAEEPQRIKDFLSDELFKTAGISLTEDQINILEKAFIDNVIIEVEESNENANVKTSLKIFNNKIVVIKTKKLSIKEMINAVIAIGSITTKANEFVVIAILLNLVGVLFITKLNDDEGEIYAYLAYQYFGKNKKVSNVDIYETLKQYYNKTYDETISDRKINSVLKRLENDLRVIEFVDGYLVVKDEIYFE